MRDLFGLAADKDALERRAIVQMLEQPLEPLANDMGDLGPGIVEPILQLRAGPPRIEQNGDAAGEQTAKKGGGPFRQIAHGDGDAVALLHAGLLQGFGNRQRRAAKFVIACPLIPIDDECLSP